MLLQAEVDTGCLGVLASKDEFGFNLCKEPWQALRDRSETVHGEAFNGQDL